MPAKSTMQINYWTVGGFEGAKTPEVALEEAKAMGYEGLEMCFGAGELAPGITEARCREIASAARALGMKIDSLATGNYWQQSLTHPDAAVRKAAVAFTKEYLQVAKWLGAGVVLVVPGAVAVPWDDSQPVVPYADAWKRATAGIKACVKTAEKLKVTIAVENVWNWFLADPVAMREFVDQFKSKRVGVYFDVGNCLLNGYPEHWIAMLGKRLKAIHFKNFSRSDCAGGLHGFGDDLMAGDVDWPAVVAALDKVKYTGPITAEMIPFSRLPDLVLPDLDLARDTAPKMRSILGRG
ncbi:MAG: sugar phosphate isomerase/epimerase family protein [Planctomycetota bacterium]|jgi:hexulose-6-phosphate isomerase